MSESKRGGAQLARAVEKAYQAGQDDYHLEPMVLVENSKPVGKIGDGDAAVFCCRRGEREIELTELFTDPDFNKVQRNQLKDLDFVIMTMYHDKFKDLPIAFAPSHVVKPLAQVLSEAGKNQFHCAESEKYAHVTFFFNGGVETQFPGEDRVLVPSPKVATYDLQPEMSAYEVCDKCVERIESGAYDVIILNFARDLLVDDDAMAAALASGKVARYVTDFPNGKTANMPGCIAIPHLGASTEESEDNCAKMAVQELMDYLENGNIRNSVNYPNCDMGICRAEGRITLLHRNIPNSLGRFTAAIAGENINIDGLMNKSRGEYAYTMLDLDRHPSADAVEHLKQIDGVLKVRVIK